MADNYTNTLAGLLMLNDANMADIYPTNLLDDAPVLARALAIPASSGGTLHKYLRRSAAAGSAFRKINTGVTNAAEQFDDISLNCEYFDPSFDRDVALAKGPNVTRGERLVYNTKTGIANFDGGRVRGFFVPGSTEPPTPAPRR
jgi:lipopolysaccharide export system protein LptA